MVEKPDSVNKKSARQRAKLAIHAMVMAREGVIKTPTKRLKFYGNASFHDI
jgi:hypothetical protein